MALMIYNSLSNKIEEFVPHKANEVNMYVCGPTVYNYIHIGNARPVIFYDMLKNYLTFIGYKVNYASNITDVDDKIINEAIKEGKTEKEIAEKYENAFFEATKLIGSNKPDFIPHATDYINQIIAFISQLVDKGYAYIVDGNVYFRIDKISDYGCLSNQVREELALGVRKDVDDKKENPLDFALWKKTDVGIKWDSPFGLGRPGWHTECVVMNHDLFGSEIDIHGGGMDLKFPHHENEIAQSEALYGNHLSKYWVHVGRLDLLGEKMSKSLGNVIFVKDLSEHDAMILRMIIVFSPYRSIISYSNSLFEQYSKEYEKWQRTLQQATTLLQVNDIRDRAYDDSDISEFKKFMNQDFNVQNVMTLLQQILKEINQAIRSKDYDEVSKKYNSFRTIIDVLGLKFNLKVMNEDDLSIYRLWLDARNAKDFEKADIYRNKLIEKGII